MEPDFAIVGGGIVGLSVGWALTRRFPGAGVLVLEKETDLALHQTGRNSGVIHSGLYYRPGSLKARMAREGSRALVAFCREHGLPYEVCGKVIVATEPEEIPRLEALVQRGLENQIPVVRIGLEALRELEPHVRACAALHVLSAGITDYRRVAETYATLIRQGGGEIRCGVKVERITQTGHGVQIETNRGPIAARLLINCAGLYSDRIARAAHAPTKVRIVPFRGEYYTLRPDRAFLVKNLIYPVPNPEFPFLGVHFTRMVSGEIHAGPNAVLSLAREGYHKTDVNWRDLVETLTYPGFWKLAARNAREGIREMVRSLSKAAFVRSLRAIIPEIGAEDIVPAPAGVRAQALDPNGRLVDDFQIVSSPYAIHVCNAPSPAATASLEIGNYVADAAARAAKGT